MDGVDVSESPFPSTRYRIRLRSFLAGDHGFDYAGFTNTLRKQWLIGGEEGSIKWGHEAERHGRVAQLAVEGNLVPGWVGHFPRNYSEEEYFEKQEQEIKRGRLSMFGALGMLLQAMTATVCVVVLPPYLTQHIPYIFCRP